MARYFGHKPAWGQPRVADFAYPRGGPVADTNPNPYNKGGMGREGQIIPPRSSREYRQPRGRSLPGYARPLSTPPSVTSPWQHAMHAGRLAGALSGLLTAANLAQLISDWWTGDEYWYGQPSGWTIPAGWTRCTDPACTDRAPDAERWGASAICPPPGTFACLQLSGAGQPYGTGHPTRQLVLTGYQDPNLANWRIQDVFVRSSPLITQMPQWTTGQTRMNAPAPFVRNPAWQDTKLPETSRRSRSRAMPREAPSVRFTGGTPSGGQVTNPYPHVPPPLNTREKKALVLLTGKWGKAYGALTEFKDFLDCMSKNIPGNPCGGLKRLGDQVMCVAKHEAEINMPGAITCFFEEQGKDSVIGKSSKLADQITQDPHWRRPVGPSAGSWAVPKVPKMTPI